MQYGVEASLSKLVGLHVLIVHHPSRIYQKNSLILGNIFPISPSRSKEVVN